MLKAFVAVTDQSWFEFLRSRNGLDEVNFWQPGGRTQFHALSVGEPFLFKLHSPHNFVVGGGFFTHSSLIPCSLAWEAFGEKNGAASLHEMRRQIDNYRRAHEITRSDPTIGCIILRSPFFLPDEDWIPVPENWSPNIVQGRMWFAKTWAGHRVVRVSVVRPPQCLSCTEEACHRTSVLPLTGLAGGVC